MRSTLYTLCMHWKSDTNNWFIYIYEYVSAWQSSYNTAPAPLSGREGNERPNGQNKIIQQEYTYGGKIKEKRCGDRDTKGLRIPTLSGLRRMGRE